MAEIETSDYHQQDWSRRGRIDDFIGAFADWSFDFLDVPGLIRGADAILEYPMVDKDPLSRWSFGRITLLGDAAHPMYPRGSNGAGQAILDARALADSFASGGDVAGILKAYEDKRLEATASVVRANRTTRPTSSSRRSTSVPATSPSPGWRMSSPRTSWRRCRTATRRSPATTRPW